jgi:hypothetical protein
MVLKGGEYALRYLRYKQLSRKIVKMSLVDKGFGSPRALRRLASSKLSRTLKSQY